MDFYNLPVGKRTRHQWLLYVQGLYGNDESRSCGSSKNRDKKRNRETEDDEITKKGSNRAGISKKRKLDEAKDEILSSDKSGEDSSEGSEDPSRSNEVDKSSSIESGEDRSNEKGFDKIKSRPCGSSSGYGKDDIEIIDVDDYWINRKGSKGSSSLPKRELHEAKPVDKSLVDESEEEQSNENGSGVRATSADLEKLSVDVSTKGGSDQQEGKDTDAVAKNEKKECFGSADESDSDDTVMSDDEGDAC